jgi:hypothetical protein
VPVRTVKPGAVPRPDLLASSFHPPPSRPLSPSWRRRQHANSRSLGSVSFRIARPASFDQTVRGTREGTSQLRKLNHVVSTVLPRDGPTVHLKGPHITCLGKDQRNLPFQGLPSRARGTLRTARQAVTARAVVPSRQRMILNYRPAPYVPAPTIHSSSLAVAGRSTPHALALSSHARPSPSSSHAHISSPPHIPSLSSRSAEHLLLAPPPPDQ